MWVPDLQHSVLQVQETPVDILFLSDSSQNHQLVLQSFEPFEFLDQSARMVKARLPEHSIRSSRGELQPPCDGPAGRWVPARIANIRAPRQRIASLNFA